MKIIDITKCPDEVINYINELTNKYAELEKINKELDKSNITILEENEELKKIQCTFLGTGCKAEIERLNNIIKEALILIENSRFDNMYAYDEILLPILNKLRESGIRNYIKVEE